MHQSVYVFKQKHINVDDALSKILKNGYVY